eukprot:TRINITY_DN23425_c1_g1_i2.p2 TRINITY_DN23425_c1_g1~~TRINITY_DN23425_c1_g1_i2.p2  ORF type:complete len:122 (+),score=0.10 TRINITY_DN23425_c1_g1_i2:1644-2009(+)
MSLLFLIFTLLCKERRILRRQKGIKLKFLYRFLKFLLFNQSKEIERGQLPHSTPLAPPCGSIQIKTHKTNYPKSNSNISGLQFQKDIGCDFKIQLSLSRLDRVNSALVTCKSSRTLLLPSH